MPSRTAPSVLVVITLFLAGFVGFAKAPEAFAADPTRAERLLIHAVNDARRAHGVRRLTLAGTLQTGSHRWASYLLYHDAFFHGSLGYGVRENIAWLTCRDGWARTTVRMWLNSSGHRSALLDRGARRLGVGVARGNWSGWSCVRMSVARFR
jgi:uncharacterized protein YkwD